MKYTLLTAKQAKVSFCKLFDINMSKYLSCSFNPGVVQQVWKIATEVPQPKTRGFGPSRPYYANARSCEAAGQVVIRQLLISCCFGQSLMEEQI